MPRKTIRVSELMEQANSMLAQSTCSKAERMMLCSFVDWVLMKTGNYSGFLHLTADEVPKGELPGIEIGKEKNTFPDESRRRYIVVT